MEVKKELFDASGNANIMLFTFKNKKNQSIQITNYGGIVHSWTSQNRDGAIEDILLGCTDLSDYLGAHPYFGCIVGRFGNRISNASFSINNQSFQLSKNHNAHHLHGGFRGFDKKIWGFNLKESEGEVQLELHCLSRHMEEGYPGNMIVSVLYTFNDSNELTIEYFAETDQDTHVNLTNHCYFNLSGHPESTILDHRLQIHSSKITETNEELIPTGNFENILDTELDFTEPRLIGDRIHAENPVLKAAKGFDHNYILENSSFESPVAKAIHDGSGRYLEVFTTEPGIQLYTGNWLKGTVGKHGMYQDYSGFCLETQHFPDTPNHAHFPTTLLRKGGKYYSKTRYKVGLI